LEELVKVRCLRCQLGWFAHPVSSPTLAGCPGKFPPPDPVVDTAQSHSSSECRTEHAPPGGIQRSIRTSRMIDYSVASKDDRTTFPLLNKSRHQLPIVEGHQSRKKAGACRRGRQRRV